MYCDNVIIEGRLRYDVINLKSLLITENYIYNDLQVSYVRNLSNDKRFYFSLYYYILLYPYLTSENHKNYFYYCVVIIFYQ